MDELFARVAENLTGRLTGPLTFRLVLQPAVAILLAIRAGFADAREQRPAFLWAVLTDPSHRRELLADGWKSIAKVFTLAIVLDAVYQIIVLRWVYPGEALIVASLLALLPYALLRGAVNRLLRAVLPSARGEVRT